jgi:nucleotide-binding universal stress UspA family protein
MILIAYDGTESSDHAIDVAGALLGGGRAHVLNVWQPLAEPAEPLGLVAAVPPVPEQLDAERARAEGIADAGARRARAAGFEAEGEAIEAVGSTSAVIEAAIDRHRPELVVIGSRGLTGFAALLRGSISHHVCAHAHAPVLVVPLPPA